MSRVKEPDEQEHVEERDQEELRKRTTIRGVRIVREEDVPPNRGEENLRYEIDVYDTRDNFIECLGRLRDLQPAIAAFSACCAKYPEARLFLLDQGRVIRRYE